MKKSAGIFLMAVVFLGCKSNDYEKTTSGLQYKIHTKNEGARIKENDWVTINLSWRNEKDSVVQSGQPQPIRVTKPAYNSDFMEGFTLLTKNDSATFVVSVDSMFKGAQLPPDIKSGTFWKLDIKVLEVMNDEQVQQKMQGKEQEAMQQAMKLLEEDLKMIEQYLADKNIKAEKAPEGYYYIVDKQGRGENAKAGDTVSIHYTGMLLDGTVFDSSKEGKAPLEFPLGDGVVVAGWELGLTHFSKGGKGRLFIPSPLGFGPQQRSEILKPNSILVFDVEMVNCKRMK